VARASGFVLPNHSVMARRILRCAWYERRYWTRRGSDAVSRMLQIAVPRVARTTDSASATVKAHKGRLYSQLKL